MVHLAIMFGSQDIDLANTGSHRDPVAEAATDSYDYSCFRMGSEDPKTSRCHKTTILQLFGLLFPWIEPVRGPAVFSFQGSSS